MQSKYKIVWIFFFQILLHTFEPHNATYNNVAVLSCDFQIILIAYTGSTEASVLVWANFIDI